MALPALQKTYTAGSTMGGTELLHEQVSGAHGATLIHLKNALLSVWANPWTVISSCDAAAFGNNDNVDRWLIPGDAQPRSTGINPTSWIVLQQTGIAAKFQIKIEMQTALDAGGENDIAVYMSPSAGFGAVNGGTDGTLQNGPTATDDVFCGGVGWMGDEGFAPTAKLMSIIQSTDGEVTRIIISHDASALPITVMGFEKPRLPSPDWANPAVGYCFSDTVASGLSVLRWEKLEQQVFAVSGGANGGAARMMHPMLTSNEIVDYLDDDNPTPLLWGNRLHQTSPEQTSITGALFDWYWVTRNVVGVHAADLDTFPATNDKSTYFVDDTSNPTSALQISDGAQTGLDPASLTIEAWINVTSWGAFTRVYICDKEQPGTAGYTFRVHSNGLLVLVQSTQGGFPRTVSITDVPYSTDTWIHFAVTRDQTTGETRFYKNGVQVGATQIFDIGTAITNSTEKLLVGTSDNSLADIHGYMADLRIWSVARTPTEILNNYNVALVGNEANLEGYWQLRTDFDDLTANANHLTAIAGGSVIPAIVSDVGNPIGSIPAEDRTFVCVGDCVWGWLDDSITNLSYSSVIANALKLDSLEYLEIADGSYAGLNAYTVEMWVRAPSPSALAWRGVYGSGDSHWQCYCIAHNNISSWGDKGNGLSVLHSYTDDTWEHWAWVFTTTTFTLFVNGVQVLSPLAANNVTVSTGLVRLGHTPAGGVPFAGPGGDEPCYLADVRHWNFARSGAQILADYQSPLAGNEAGLVAYWPLQADFSQLVAGGPAAWGVGVGTPTIENGVGPVT